MQAIWLIILMFAVPFFIYSIFLYSKISLFKPNLISFVFWFYLCFAFVGILPLYFGWDEYRTSVGITDKDIIFKILVFSSIAYLIFMFSYFFFSKVFNYNTHKTNTLTGQDSNLTELNSVHKVYLFILLGISTVIFAFYLSRLPEIPLLAVIKGYSSTEVKQFRSLSTNDFSGSLHYYKLFFETTYTFITFAFFSNYLLKPSKQNKVLFLISIVLAAFGALYSTQKAVIIWLIIGLMFVYLITLNKKLKIKSIVKSTFFAVFILFFLYKYFMGMQEKNSLDIILSIFSRTFSGQLAPAYYYLELFPSQIQFLHGRSFPNPGGVLPWEHYRLVVEVMNFKFQHLQSVGIVGSAPTAFWGESYVNFGIYGILFFAIYVGFLLALTDLFFKKSKRTPITISIYVWLILEFKNIALTGISNFLFNLDIIWIIIIYFAMHLFLRKDSSQYIKHKKNGLNPV